MFAKIGGEIPNPNLIAEWRLWDLTEGIVRPAFFSHPYLGRQSLQRRRVDERQHLERCGHRSARPEAVLESLQVRRQIAPIAYLHLHEAAKTKQVLLVRLKCERLVEARQCCFVVSAIQERETATH